VSDIESIVKESDAQDSLKKLRRALEAIHEIVVQNGQRGRLSLVYQGTELKVFEQPGHLFAGWYSGVFRGLRLSSPCILPVSRYQYP
jgi:hypothetical protein